MVKGLTAELNYGFTRATFRRNIYSEKDDVSQPFYCTLNAKAGVQKGIVSLNVWARNITGTDYQAFYFESIDNSFIQKGKPFRIWAEIVLNF